MTALFAGTPGTGKTMAAGCIANELGLPLYRVDLSQVVDKYIGETEKKLEAVFKYAQSANVVLFFDEADALFGKRSEVKDAKDKYANTEVAFILQRIEQYSGMVILATNFINNIDEAFMRRMKYVVEFQMPEAAVRERIWRGSFSERVPQLDLDYEFLAEKIELSGGHIKNIVLNAAFLAAKDNSPVTMRHIIYCVQNEFIKLGKSVTADFFGEYAYCLS
jgi:SpoVK/Ycf46/Vps4 family AAA+-type ATPase